MSSALEEKMGGGDMEYGDVGVKVGDDGGRRKRIWSTARRNVRERRS